MLHCISHAVSCHCQLHSIQVRLHFFSPNGLVKTLAREHAAEVKTGLSINPWSFIWNIFTPKHFFREVGCKRVQCCMHGPGSRGDWIVLAASLLADRISCLRWGVSPWISEWMVCNQRHMGLHTKIGNQFFWSFKIWDYCQYIFLGYSQMKKPAAAPRRSRSNDDLDGLATALKPWVTHDWIIW